MNQHSKSAPGRIVWRPIIAIVLVAISAGVVWSFLDARGEAARDGDEDAPIKAPLRVSQENGLPVVRVDAATRTRNGIDTAAPSPTPYRREARAYATVLDLTTLTNLDNSYTNATAQLQTVQARLAASRAAFKRAQRLYEDRQNISKASFQSAEATYRIDEAALLAARSQVRTLAATAQQEWGPVIGKSVSDGSPEIGRLIERREFLLQVTLPAGVVLGAPPRTATIEIGNGRRGKISYLSPATRTDPKIQGVSYFYIAAAATGVLPGMNLVALLPSGPAVPGVTVPATAIVWWKNRAWVYRPVGADAFSRTEIPTGLPAPGGGFIVKAADLPNTSEIVTRGAQLLLSEEFRAQIQLGDD